MDFERILEALLRAFHEEKIRYGVIGFKVQALANNPLRRAKETADIEALAAHYGSQLDWNRIQRYYDLFELGQEAHTLRAHYEHPRQS